MSVHVLHTRREESRPGWAAAIASELDLVEQKMGTTIASHVPAASEVCAHLLSAGGKRIRPAAVVLSALCIPPGAVKERVIQIAAAVELVHMASLVHDDVIDETCERRGAATANNRWGNKMSVLGGDFMLAKAYCLLAADGDPEISRLLAATAVKMTEGEVLQAASEGSLQLWKANYWCIIHGKTANFIGACCECGAVLAGADSAARRALSEYGAQVGLAFQITDDVLDIVGDPSQTGKEVGADLMHGKFTLPVLLALQGLDDERKRAMSAVLSRGMLTREEALQVADLLIECGAVERARDTASECAANARDQLVRLPCSPYRDSLDALTSFVVDRES